MITITHPATYADLLDRDAKQLESRAANVRKAAELLRTLPDTQVAPALEIAAHLAAFGLAVVAVEALMVAEACMQLTEPEDDGLGQFADHDVNIDEWGMALKAVRESIRKCGRYERKLTT